VRAYALVTADSPEEAVDVFLHGAATDVTADHLVPVIDGGDQRPAPHALPPNATADAAAL
jgi:hypothetical protein